MAPSIAESLTGVSSAIFVAGVVMLVLRYVRTGPAHRKRIRLLLVLAVIGAFAVFANLLIGMPNWFASATFSVFGISLGIALALGILDLPALDVDVLLRRTTLYGLLWLLIARGVCWGSGCARCDGRAAFVDGLGCYFDSCGDARPPAGS